MEKNTKFMAMINDRIKANKGNREVLRELLYIKSIIEDKIWLNNKSYEEAVREAKLEGIGKSSIVKDVAKELGISIIDVRISQLEPSDLRGLPKIDNGERRIKWQKKKQQKPMSAKVVGKRLLQQANPIS